MAENIALIAEDVTLVISHSGDAAGVYSNGTLRMTGHVSDIMERLIDALGVNTEFVDDIVTDHTVRGWGGVAKTLDDLGLEA